MSQATTENKELAKLQEQHGEKTGDVVRTNHLKQLNAAAKASSDNDAALLAGEHTDNLSNAEIVARLLKLENPGVL
jgi:hypothetical protein